MLLEKHDVFLEDFRNDRHNILSHYGAVETKVNTWMAHDASEERQCALSEVVKVSFEFEILDVVLFDTAVRFHEVDPLIGSMHKKSIDIHQKENRWILLITHLLEALKNF